MRPIACENCGKEHIRLVTICRRCGWSLRSVPAQLARAHLYRRALRMSSIVRAIATLGCILAVLGFVGLFPSADEWYASPGVAFTAIIYGLLAAVIFGGFAVLIDLVLEATARTCSDPAPAAQGSGEGDPRAEFGSFIDD